MKLSILAICLLAGSVLAQSKFDPVVADQIRHQQQELEALKRKVNGEPEPPPKPPEKPSASFHYQPGEYEKAVAKYQADLAQYEAKKRAQPTPTPSATPKS